MYVLFGIANQYDATDQFCYLWEEKPSLIEVAKAFNVDFSTANEQAILDMVALFRGAGSRISNVDYHIEKIEFNTKYGHLS